MPLPVAPYLTLKTAEAPQRVHSLREIFNGLRWVARAGAPWRGSMVHMAVDTLGHLLALHVTAANAQERAQVGRLAEQVQAVTGETVEVAFVDQGYTGD